MTVNGAVAALGDKADLDLDTVTLDGKAIKVSEEPRLYLMLNKPRGYVTTLSDENGRKTVVELVGDCGSRVWPVGRLDLDTDGLLLLTNDGALTNALTHPAGEVDKEYHVWVSGDTAHGIAVMSELTVLEDGTPIRRPEVKCLGGQRISVTIHEGKNRQVRRMCAMAGLAVKRLQRVREGTLNLGDLPLGKWRALTAGEVDCLKQESGISCKQKTENLQK